MNRDHAPHLAAQRRLLKRLKLAEKHVKKARNLMFRSQQAFIDATSAALSASRLLTEKTRRSLLSKMDKAQSLHTKHMNSLLEIEEEHKAYFRIWPTRK